MPPALTGSGSDVGLRGGGSRRAPTDEVADLPGGQAERAGQALGVVDGVEDEADAADEGHVLGSRWNHFSSAVNVDAVGDQRAGEDGAQ